MNLIKYLYSYILCLLVLLFASNAICNDKEKEKYEPDQALVQASKTKAKELGHPCIMVYKEEKEGATGMFGEIHFGASGQYFAENDMIVNVGDFPVPIGDFTLSKGEYAVVKGGKFLKQSAKITSKR